VNQVLSYLYRRVDDLSQGLLELLTFIDQTEGVPPALKEKAQELWRLFPAAESPKHKK